MKIGSVSPLPRLEPLEDVSAEGVDSSADAGDARLSYAHQAKRDAQEIRHVRKNYMPWVDEYAPWRGEDARVVIQATFERLAILEEDFKRAGQPLEIAGVTPTVLYFRKFVINPAIDDAQLVAMSKVQPQQLATPPEKRKEVVEEFPDYAQQPSHRLAVALLSAICDIPYSQLSALCPDMGFSGTAGTRLWRPGEGIFEQLMPDFVATTEEFELANVLHDTTDSLEQAGIEGTNEDVWGVDGAAGSACLSVIRALFENPAE